jgi:hypothetical protein
MGSGGLTVESLDTPSLMLLMSLSTLCFQSLFLDLLPFPVPLFVSFPFPLFCSISVLKPLPWLDSFLIHSSIWDMHCSFRWKGTILQDQLYFSIMSWQGKSVKPSIQSSTVTQTSDILLLCFLYHSYILPDEWGPTIQSLVIHWRRIVGISVILAGSEPISHIASKVSSR